MEFLGTVINIRFHSEENFYTVADIETEDGNITVTGRMPMINIGDDIKIEGELVYHPKYGEQINGTKIEKVMPTTPDRIEKYLSSGIFPYIGKKTAKKIVSMYKEKSLDIIQEDKDALLRIPGLGVKKAKAIREKVIEESSVREIVIFLQSLGLGTKQSVNIYSKYKEDTIQKIQTNPYQLIDDIDGIGFLRADQIALKNGIKRDSSYRINAAIEYVLSDEAYTNGNIFLKKDILIDRATELLGINREFIENPLFDLEINGKIKYDRNNENIYLTYFYSKEQNVAKRIVEILNDKSIEKIKMDYDIEIFNEIEFSDEQIHAVEKSVNENFTIITGGPGTGKTTIIRAIIEVFEREKVEYKLAAPTGRAAKRMEESTNREAQTIHRLLGSKGIDNDGIAEYNAENPLECEALIIDETSMVDISLMDSLLNAIGFGTRLIFVGDIDQLPSVGPGNVLSDMISSGEISVFKLNKIYRQKEDSNIVINAHKINKGEKPIVNKEGGGFYLLRTKSEEDTLNTILDLVDERLPKHYNLSKDDIQVLSPMRRGLCGVDNLNEKLQERLNPEKFGKEEIEFKDIIFRESDRVMQIKNNYNIEYKGKTKGQGVYNGDIGKIRKIDYMNEVVKVMFDDEKIVDYEYKELEELQLSYAITIHKSQGSEFSCVVIPIVNGPFMLLTRNIIYTAITRAKKLVVLVGSEEILEKMINNNRELNRNSSLDKRIKEYKDILVEENWQ